MVPVNIWLSVLYQKVMDEVQTSMNDSVSTEVAILLKPHVIVTSSAKGAYGFGRVVSLFVCLYVCKQHLSKSYKLITMKFSEGVLVGTMTNLADFGGDLGLLK